MLRFERWRATEGGPSYDCLHCRRPEKQPERIGDCEECALPAARRAAHDLARTDIGELLGEEIGADELAEMQKIYETVGSSLAVRHKTFDPRWSVEYAYLVRVVVYERNRSEFEESWTRTQEMKNRARN